VLRTKLPGGGGGEYKKERGTPFRETVLPLGVAPRGGVATQTLKTSSVFF